jgi:predicted acyltransferase
MGEGETFAETLLRVSGSLFSPHPIPLPEGEGTHRRLVSLDVFRGLTIAGMIVVNTPGTWEHVYPPLLHAEWHGWTYTDTIFPFFLFIVGVAMAFSFGRRMAKGKGRRALLLHTFWRAAVIFLLGFGLNWLSVILFHREHVRIPGVLQRIAVCFLCAALVYLAFGKRGLLPVTAVLLVGYWLLMTRVPVPGYGPGRLDVEGNLAAYVDQQVLGEHTWKHNPGWDPEGLLSTLPAIATVLFGILAGLTLGGDRPLRVKTRILTLAGSAGLAVGLLWGIVFPINKNLWTSSYCVLMAGLAALSLALCVLVVDFKHWRFWTPPPFQWLGANALFLFVASDLVTILMIGIKLTGADGKRRSLYGTIYKNVFDHFADPRLGSLLFALTTCAVWTAVAGLLYRKRLFFKV